MRLLLLFGILSYLSGYQSMAQEHSACAQLLLPGYIARPIGFNNAYYSEVAESQFLVRMNANSQGWIRGMHPAKVSHVMAIFRTYRSENGVKTKSLHFEVRKGYPRFVRGGNRVDDTTGQVGLNRNMEKYAALAMYINDLHIHSARNRETYIRPFVAQSIEHAKRWYPRRNWSDGFLAGMDTTASEHLWNSRYIAVIREKIDGPEQWLATIRAIDSAYEVETWIPLYEIGKPTGATPIVNVRQMRYPLGTYFNHNPNQRGVEYALNRLLLYGNRRSPRRLPNNEVTHKSSARPYYPVGERIVNVEEEDGTIVPHCLQLGVGVTFEPGIWAIDPTANAVGFAETLLHLLAYARWTHESVPADYFRRAVNFSIYGDEVSVRLYGRMGFQTTHSEPVQKYGSNWWQLEINGDTIERLWANLTSVRQGVDSEEANNLRATLEVLLRHH